MPDFKINVASYTTLTPLARVPGWLTFNAARPLYGSHTWEGDFHHGVFYVEVDPASPAIKHWLEDIKSLDGWLVIAETKEHILERMRFIYTHHEGLTDAEFDAVDWEDIERAWHDRTWGQIVQIQITNGVCHIERPTPGDLPNDPAIF